MKEYEVGDEVLVKCRVIEIDKRDADLPIKVMFPRNPAPWLSPEEIYELPPVWRDGAVEKPEIGSTVLYYKKEYGDKCLNIIMVTPVDEWHDYYWLYVSELPIPATPQPAIEPCPFCGGADEIELYTNASGMSFVECACGYTTRHYTMADEAINAHNEFVRKMKA